MNRLGLGVLLTALVTSCSSREELVADVPDVASSIPGDAVFVLLDPVSAGAFQGNQSVRTIRRILTGSTPTDKVIVEDIDGAEWVQMSGSQVGWASLAESRNFRKAWSLGGLGAGSSALYCDLQILIDSLQREAAEATGSDPIAGMLTGTLSTFLTAFGIDRFESVLLEPLPEDSATGLDYRGFLLCPSGSGGLGAALAEPSRPSVLDFSAADTSLVRFEAYTQTAVLERMIRNLADSGSSTGLEIGLGGAQEMVWSMVRSVSRRLDGRIALAVGADGVTVAALGLSDPEGLRQVFEDRLGGRGGREAGELPEVLGLSVQIVEDRLILMSGRDDVPPASSEAQTRAFSLRFDPGSAEDRRPLESVRLLSGLDLGAALRLEMDPRDAVGRLPVRIQID